MKKMLYTSTLFLLFFAVLFAGEIPKHVGPWRVDVGPPGNDFYQPPNKGDIKPPSDELLNIVKTIAPDAEVKRWRMLKNDLYGIRAANKIDEYDFVIAADGRIIELEYKNYESKVEEKPDELVIKGTKRKIALDDVPAATLDLIAQVQGEKPHKAWAAKTIAGDRFVLLAGDGVYYARPDGRIRAIGLVDHGALNEIVPRPKKEKPVITDIAADAEKRLGPYRDRFNFEKNIAELGAPGDGGFRFVVVGDSRSQYELWEAIVQHIDQLDPKPAFVINSGDIVVRGYTDEYLDYYIPPLLKTDIPYFIALGNHDDGDDGMAVEYRTLFGENSLNYFFDYGGYRFIFVDNITRVNKPEATLQWLEQTLSSTPPPMKKIVAMHKPPRDIEKWAYHSWDAKYSPQLTDMLQKHEVLHVFLGHIHAYSTARHKDVDYTISGGGGAGLHDRFGPLGNVHHYVICDVLPDGTLKQQVVRFYKD